MKPKMKKIMLRNRKTETTGINQNVQNKKIH